MGVSLPCVYVGSMIPDSSFFDFPLDFDLHYQYDEENLTCPVSIKWNCYGIVDSFACIRLSGLKCLTD